MKLKSFDQKKKLKKKNTFKTEEEREKAFVDLMIRIIVDLTLKEYYDKKS